MEPRVKEHHYMFQTYLTIQNGARIDKSKKWHVSIIMNFLLQESWKKSIESLKLGTAVRAILDLGVRFEQLATIDAITSLILHGG